MSIKGLTDRKEARFPRIGFLRKGGPKREGKNRKGEAIEIMGIDLDHFRFDSDDADACTDFAEAYGSEPKQINVFFPWPTVAENFQAWKEAYTAGALQHRCDGETCVLWLDKDGEYRTDPKPCPGNCKEIGYLSVIIPELGRFAFVTVLTHSINDIMELQSNLEAYELLGGQLRGVPFVLRRIERKISTPGQNGKRVRRAKWLMHLETKPEWTRLKLAGMDMDAIPTSVRAALPAPVEAQYVIENYQAEQAAARIDAMTYPEQQEMLQANVNRMRGPERNAFDEADGEYRVETLTAEQPAQPATNEQAPFGPTIKDAVDWACQTAPQVWATDKSGMIVRENVVRSLKKLSEQGLTGDALALAWIAKVNDKLATWEAAQPSAAGDDGDGWADVDAAGHDADEPQFS